MDLENCNTPISTMTPVSNLTAGVFKCPLLSNSQTFTGNEEHKNTQSDLITLSCALANRVQCLIGMKTYKL